LGRVLLRDYPASNTMVATYSRMRAWTVALLSISFCATRYGTASATNAALTEEKIQLSKIGKLHYADLSDDEKLDLFQEYKIEYQRRVRDCDDLLECSELGLDDLTIIPKMTLDIAFCIRTVLVNR
jgi:hypothetical protein